MIKKSVNFNIESSYAAVRSHCVCVIAYLPWVFLEIWEVSNKQLKDT